MFVHFIYRLRAHTRKKFLIVPDAMCLAARKKCGWGIQHLLQLSFLHPCRGREENESNLSLAGICAFLKGSEAVDYQCK